MKNIMSKLPAEIGSRIKFKNINEISIRAEKKVVVKADNLYYRLDYVTSRAEIESIVKKFCDLSVYAYLDEIKNGFITIEGGHRIGVCGTAVIKDNQLYNIKNINSVNIRVANAVVGCSEKLKFPIKNLLIISPPCCGKTTIVRDLCRRLGKNYKVGIADERGEIAGVHNGLSCFDIGDMTDVLSLVSKSAGIEYLLRSMSPDYIVTDEIASDDYEAINRAFSYGVRVIATAHGDNICHTLKRLGLNGREFHNIVLLNNKNGIGTIEEVVYND